MFGIIIVWCIFRVIFEVMCLSNELVDGGVYEGEDDSQCVEYGEIELFLKVGYVVGKRYQFYKEVFNIVFIVFRIWVIEVGKSL